MTAERWSNFVIEIGTLLAAIAFAFVSATTLYAEDLWRHGTLVPKGDAGFIYMAAEGGFAKAEGLDLKMQAFQNDTLMMKALIAGELDSYEGSPISPLIAGSKGADVKILGCTWPKLTSDGGMPACLSMARATTSGSEPGAEMPIFFPLRSAIAPMPSWENSE